MDWQLRLTVTTHFKMLGAHNKSLCEAAQEITAFEEHTTQKQTFGKYCYTQNARVQSSSD